MYICVCMYIQASSPMVKCWGMAATFLQTAWNFVAILKMAFPGTACCTRQVAIVCCGVLQYIACVAVCCSVPQCVAVCYCLLQCVAMCCSVLLCFDVCCSVLQRGVLCCSVWRVLQYHTYMMLIDLIKYAAQTTSADLLIMSTRVPRHRCGICCRIS